MTLSIEDYRRFYADEIRFVANLDSPALALLKVQSLRREPRQHEATRLLHGKGVCFSSAVSDD